MPALPLLLIVAPAMPAALLQGIINEAMDDSWGDDEDEDEPQVGDRAGGEPRWCLQPALAAERAAAALCRHCTGALAGPRPASDASAYHRDDAPALLLPCCPAAAPQIEGAEARMFLGCKFTFLAQLPFLASLHLMGIQKVPKVRAAAAQAPAAQAPAAQAPAAQALLGQLASGQQPAAAASRCRCAAVWMRDWLTCGPLCRRRC